MSREQFFADAKTYDAVLRNLEIIGEAAQNIPDEIRNQHSDIGWRKIVGLRDIAIHQYFGINEDVLWDVVNVKIIELKVKIAMMLADMNRPRGGEPNVSPN